MSNSPYRPATLWQTARTALRSYLRHDPATLGAALAYYTIFSIAPVLIIVIAVAGSVFGPDAVRGGIKGQIGGLIGPEGAQQVETMIQGAYRPGTGELAAAAAAVLLLFGATAVFGQLRTSLNSIWDIKSPPRRDYWKYFLDRVASLGMAACLGFLLLVSLVFHAGLVGASTRFEGLAAGPWVVVLETLELLVSFGLTVLLFAIVYRFMSDARLKWRDVWAGSVLTAVLFGAGKYAIGAYLGTRNIGDTYGVAGSSVLLLLWVYYSSQVLFFGAEFTRAFAATRGAKIVPPELAVPGASG